jgi:hypothetical protein
VLRDAMQRDGDKPPVGSIAKAHRLATLACRDLDLAPPRYRTVGVQRRNGVPSAEVVQALSDELE